MKPSIIISIIVVAITIGGFVFAAGNLRGTLITNDTRLEEKIDHVANDVTDIKNDVKILVGEHMRKGGVEIAKNEEKN